jgi:hypothetical protein
MSALISFIDYDDDILDALLLVALVLFLVAAYAVRVTVPAAIGYVGLAVTAAALMFVTGP